MARGQRAARRGSWVTSMMVWPRRCSSPKSRMISSPVALSRLPVGSSARSSDGLAHQRAGDGHALPLAAGELVRLVVHAVREPHRLERLHRLRPPLRAREAAVDERQLDVGERGGARQQLEGLEDEADLAVAQVGQLRRRRAVLDVACR